MSSLDVGIYVGRFICWSSRLCFPAVHCHRTYFAQQSMQVSRPIVTCKSKIFGKFVVSVRPFNSIRDYSTTGVWQLDQTQLFRPFDGRPSTVDVEFAVDALGVGADRTQADHEFTGDLRTGELGFEQPEIFQFTLAEWLNQGLRSGGLEGR